MKRIFVGVIALLLVFSVNCSALELKSEAKSVILCEASTGKVLYEENADKALPPASVTKIMTLLLVFEAADRGELSFDDTVTASARAAGMGGSQIYLKEGETMTVDELVKSVAVASANDAALALAEYVCGSEEQFVMRMNERAAELGMVNTHFENTNGLDDTTASHLTSARDIALMSAELMRHKKIFEYTTIWMDTVRGGQFGLTNTNRLIRFYQGANGLKTGSTSRAGFCISATAERDGMQLIAVVMGAPGRDARNECAKLLLDYGFANYAFSDFPAGEVTDIGVKGSRNGCITGEYPEFSYVSEKNGGSITKSINIDDDLSAPIDAGSLVGSVVYERDGTVLHEDDIVCREDCPRLGFADIFFEVLRSMLLL